MPEHRKCVVIEAPQRYPLLDNGSVSIISEVTFSTMQGQLLLDTKPLGTFPWQPMTEELLEVVISMWLTPKF
jgi:hypothetical protein